MMHAAALERSAVESTTTGGFPGPATTARFGLRKAARAKADGVRKAAGAKQQQVQQERFNKSWAENYGRLSEKEVWLKAQDSGLNTMEDLIFSLLNTQQFIFIQ